MPKMERHLEAQLVVSYALLMTLHFDGKYTLIRSESLVDTPFSSSRPPNQPCGNTLWYGTDEGNVSYYSRYPGKKPLKLHSDKVLTEIMRLFKLKWFNNTFRRYHSFGSLLYL